MSLSCRLSAFFRPTTQTASIDNRLVAIVHTKPVIANCIPKLAAMATSVSTSGPPSNVIPWAHPSPQPKRHLYRFSCFCTDDCRMSTQFTKGHPFPLRNCSFHGDLDPHLIHGSLGPPESSTQTASR